jgi:eukaryotic-like serine/threonine-protein kinase
VTVTNTLSHLTAALADRYRVERELGAGGMATVYLAEDLRHGRRVAIKVLHEDLGATLGPERFLAEIRTTAQLQHPHILPLLDSGSTAPAGAGGLLYYVMPFIDGESLRERLTREKQLPIDDAVRITREVADALAHAHGQNIVHRDIKPENILLQGGHALVADFGIALAVQQAGGARLTQTGLSLGTPQYMAPEQAMGEKSVDPRADVYALGVVTYEMLVGEPPFTGATVQAIVAKVLSSNPEPPSTIRRTIPAHVEDAVLTALAKLPADRFSSVASYAAALGGGGASAPTTSRAAARVQPRTRWVAGALALGAVVGVGLGYLAWHGRDSTATADVSRTYVRLAATEVLPEGVSDFVLSPDGSSAVYVGPGEQPGATQLWRKRRSELHAVRMPGTQGGSGPFFSPDGASIAFLSPNGLSRLSLAGGDPTIVARGDITSEGHGAWLPDGRIVFTNRTRVDVVNADGGQARTLVPNDRLNGFNPITIQSLPDGRGLLVQTCPALCPRATVYVVDAATGDARLLLTDGRSPTWLPTGHVAWISASGALLTAAFDLETRTLQGEPVPLIERVSAFAVSARGHLMYREGLVGEAAQPVWVDRSGRATPVDSGWVDHITSFGLSPDGRHLAASISTDGEQHIWIKELPRGPLSKLTFGSSLEHFRPFWSADGRQVRFVIGDTTFRLAEKDADGGSDMRILSYPGHRVVEGTSSRDGVWLVARTGGTDTSRALLGRRLNGDAEPRALIAGGANRLGIALSPDARFIAYRSARSGKPEVYVSPFPEVAAAAWQVSLGGGTEARWSEDGRTLYYVSDTDTLMAARVVLTPTFAVRATEALFDVSPYARDGGFHMFEPEPRGDRFFMLRRQPFPGELVQVDDWFAEVRTRFARTR